MRRTILHRHSLVSALAVLLLGACMHMGARPQNLDMARTRTTTNGMYQVAIHPDADSIPKGRLHRWIVSVKTPAGIAVDSAAIKVDGGMPQHGHGLPTKPRMTRALGGGDYLVDRMKFNMGGWWELDFRIDAAAGADSVTFNIDL